MCTGISVSYKSEQCGLQWASLSDLFRSKQSGCNSHINVDHLEYIPAFTHRWINKKETNDQWLLHNIYNVTVVVLLRNSTGSNFGQQQLHVSGNSKDWISASSKWCTCDRCSLTPDIYSMKILMLQLSRRISWYSTIRWWRNVFNVSISFSKLFISCGNKDSYLNNMYAQKRIVNWRDAVNTVVVSYQILLLCTKINFGLQVFHPVKVT